MAFTPLSRVGWTITATSVYDGGPAYVAAKAIDGNTSTFWHSFSGYPHSLIVDMGAAQTFNAIQFVPRTDSTRTDPAQVEVYVSDDGSTWGSPVASDVWTSSATTKTLSFASVTKRWLKFTGVTGANNAFMACTELLAGTLTPPNVRITQEAIEVVLGPPLARVRVTQEVLEVIVPLSPAGITGSGGVFLSAGVSGRGMA